MRLTAILMHESSRMWDLTDYRVRKRHSFLQRRMMILLIESKRFTIVDRYLRKHTIRLWKILPPTTTIISVAVTMMWRSLGFLIVIRTLIIRKETLQVMKTMMSRMLHLGLHYPI